MIVFWSNHCETAFGSAAKYVRCEQCSKEYGYILHRQAKGSAISLLFLGQGAAFERALARAHHNLQRKLDHDVDPAPCPSCGHLQPDMVREAKRRHLRWMSFSSLGLVLFVGPLVFLLSLLILIGLSGREFIISPRLYCFIWLGILIAAALMPFLRILFVHFYDPRRLSPEQMLRKKFFAGIPLEKWDEAEAKRAERFRDLGISEALLGFLDIHRPHAKPHPPLQPETGEPMQ